MNIRHVWKPVMVMVGSSLLATGCVYRTEVRYRDVPPPAVAEAPGAEVEVTSAPPPVIVETETISPGPGFIWIGGYWAWGPGGWGWRHGYWGRPPHPGFRWYGPHYEFRGGRHIWVRGGWR